MLLAKQIIVAISIFALGAIPPFVKVIFLKSSLAYGLLLYCCILSLFLFRYIKFIKKTHRYVLWFFLFTFIYMLCQMLAFGVLNAKSYISIPALYFMFIVAYLAAIKISYLNASMLFGSLRLLVLLLFAVGFINIVFDFEISAYTHIQPVIPFSEPSHFALFSGPFFVMFFVTVQSDSLRLLTLSAVVAFAFWFPNLTMLIYAILMLILWAQLKIKYAVIVTTGLYIMFAVFSSTTYFKNRVDLASDSKNLSSLVYQQGVIEAYEAMFGTSFLGLGFQMMGTQPPSYVSYDVAKAMGNYDAELNREDGGFLAAKIIAEFGIFGVLIVGFFLNMAASAYTYLRQALRLNRAAYDLRAVLANCVFFAFTVELLIRGYGYFSPGVFVYVISLLLWLKYFRKSS
jgi:hypothetical protein